MRKPRPLCFSTLSPMSNPHCHLCSLNHTHFLFLPHYSHSPRNYPILLCHSLVQSELILFWEHSCALSKTQNQSGHKLIERKKICLCTQRHISVSQSSFPAFILCSSIRQVFGMNLGCTQCQNTSQQQTHPCCEI